MREGFFGERALVLPQIITRIIETDPLMSSLYVTDIGYYPVAHKHYRFRDTPIDQYILIYCVAGEGFYNIDGQSFKVKPNQYFIIPAGHAHFYGADDANPWTIYWVHFKGSLAKYYCPPGIFPCDISPNATSRIRDRIGIFEEMYNTLNYGYNIDNLRYVSSLLNLFLGSLRYVEQYRNAVKEESPADDIVDNVIHLLKENIEKNLSLEEIAGFSGFSASHFSLLFKKKTGHSPITYFNLLKIKHACTLLDTTDMKMNQICHKIGISDPYYFSRLFNKIMGIPPKEYKNLNKG